MDAFSASDRGFPPEPRRVPAAGHQSTGIVQAVAASLRHRASGSIVADAASRGDRAVGPPGLGNPRTIRRRSQRQRALARMRTAAGACITAPPQPPAADIRAILDQIIMLAAEVQEVKEMLARLPRAYLPAKDNEGHDDVRSTPSGDTTHTEPYAGGVASCSPIGNSEMDQGGQSDAVWSSFTTRAEQKRNFPPVGYSRGAQSGHWRDNTWRAHNSRGGAGRRNGGPLIDQNRGDHGAH